MQGGDRGHGEFVAGGEGFGGIGAGRGKAVAEFGEDFAGDGIGEVGEGVHGGTDRLLWGKEGRLELVMVVSIGRKINIRGGKARCGCDGAARGFETTDEHG
jgi:hypothetical protein